VDVAGRTAAEIRRHVLARGLQPGERLPSERELADQLGVSRPALREGIRQLAGQGLIETRRGAGSYVTVVGLRALLDVRLLLEPEAAALAAAECDEADRSRLASLAARLGDLVDDPASLTAVDTEIHQVIATASGNRVLESVLAGLAEMAAHQRAETSGREVVRRGAVAEMRAVVDAVVGGDASAARSAMRAHLQSVRRGLPER
jgi:GntR family transcriptional repressor for pyruvate dehydrogenase complex